MYFSRNAALAVLALTFASCTAHKNAVTMSTAASPAASSPAVSDPATAQLGALVYPGAHNVGVDAQAIRAAGGTIALFTTHDSFAQVYAFYKAQLPKDSQTTKVLNGDSSVAAFEIRGVSSHEHTTITISAKKEETDILIMHGLGDSKSSASPEATQ